MKTDLFQSCGHCWVFQTYWHIECSILTASSFKIWNSSAAYTSRKVHIYACRFFKIKRSFCAHCSIMILTLNSISWLSFHNWNILNYLILNQLYQGDFPFGPEVKTLASNARDAAGSMLGLEGKIPHAWWTKNKHIKQKYYYNKFNKDLKMVHIKKSYKIWINFIEI